MKNSDDSGYTGKHVGVCVLDTGIFPHADLKNRLAVFQNMLGSRQRPFCRIFFTEDVPSTPISLHLRVCLMSFTAHQ